MSFATQLPGYLGLRWPLRIFNRRSGQIDQVPRLVSPDSWLGRHHRVVQFGFLWAGITGRLLFINSDRTAIAVFLITLLSLAMLVGVLYGGKTWCNFLCPIAPVQRIYCGAGGLLDRPAHFAPGPLSQSTCRTSASAGASEQGTCVRCAPSCPDVDLEASHWAAAGRGDQRFVTYGYFGLVLSFYLYYYLYAGNWDYYFTGAWTHEADALGTLWAPGFFLGGRAIAVPKLVAAPLTTAALVAAAFAAWSGLERLVGWLMARRGRPLPREVLVAKMSTVCAFATFNTFYFFAGRPNIRLLPGWAQTGVDLVLVLVSSLWLARSLGRSAARYAHEARMPDLVRRIRRSRFDVSGLLGERPLESLGADEVHLLARTVEELDPAVESEGP
jgi:hypothetical protein